MSSSPHNFDAAAQGAPRQARRGHGRATLADVAAHAGVTAITVSRYLRSPKVVADGTALRIRAALGATGYVANKQAGHLASGRNNIVAALVPNLANAIFAESLQGLADTLHEAGLELLLASTDYSIQREESQVRALLGWAPQAVVVTGRHHSAATSHMLREARDGGCAVVEMWDLHPQRFDGRDGEPSFSQVGFDHGDTGRRMAEHLLTAGHRHLVYVDSAVTEDFRAHERGDGFVAAARDAGVQAQRIVALGGDPVDAGRAVLLHLQLIQPRPSACALANDHLACGLILQARATGLAVPEQLAVMGFGDFAMARQLEPPLTTMAAPRYDIGRRTAELLIGAHRGADIAMHRIDLPCSLIRRVSA